MNRLLFIFNNNIYKSKNHLKTSKSGRLRTTILQSMSGFNKLSEILVMEITSYVCRKKYSYECMTKNEYVCIICVITF